MPDNSRQTVSASQLAALWNASPYLTRYMLYHHIVNGVDIEANDNTRMAWGRRLQSVILDAAAEEMRLEIHENKGDIYTRHPDLPLGCTRDAHVIDPSRGFGIIEVKNVDSLIFMQQWGNGMAPRHIELQHQAQLMIPDPEYGMPQWGAIVAFVGGNELHILDRTLNKKLEPVIVEELGKFFDDVKNEREPDAFGSEREIPVINELYPAIEHETPLDLSNDPEAEKIEDLFIEYGFALQDKSIAEKKEKSLKTKILALAGTAGHLDCMTRTAYIKKSQRAATRTRLPEIWIRAIDEALDTVIAYDAPDNKELIETLNEILESPSIITRCASIANSIKIETREGYEQQSKPADMSDYVEALGELHGK